MKCGSIKIGEYKFDAIIPVDPREYEYGLMNRPWPPPCMAFPYKNASIRKFWMKNTPSPLDLLFCRNNKIIDICHGEPFSLYGIGPNEPSDLVIELPLGTSEKFKIKIGDCVKINTDSTKNINNLLKIASKFDYLLKNK